MNHNTSRILTSGPLGSTLFRLTVPMVFGLLSVFLFNLADTFFVARLGTEELAALTFTFPVVLIIVGLALGIGEGSSACISRAAGRDDLQTVQRITTDSIVLAMLIAVMLSMVGSLTITPLFVLLGADRALIPLIRPYMLVWYAGMTVFIVPIVGNHAIRAVGDTKTPAVVMMSAACVNILLDPVLIFGLGPVPALGMRGAALATVLGRCLTLVVAFHVLYRREKMLTFARVPLSEIWHSWKEILHIGLPAAGVKMVTPVAVGIITRMIAVYGNRAVAAFGIASRVEFFALAVVIAHSSILTPFVGQNSGAHQWARITSGLRLSLRFSLFWGGGLWLVFLLAARPIAQLFSQDIAVTAYVDLYLKILAAAYGMYGVLLMVSAALNALKKPFHSFALNILHLFMLYVPLAMAGSHFGGMTGMFAGMAVSYWIAAAGAVVVLKRALAGIRQKEA